LAGDAGGHDPLDRGAFGLASTAGVARGSASREPVAVYRSLASTNACWVTASLPVTDPRKRRGVRHSITAIVAVALAATLAGAQSFVTIGEWVADAGDADLAALGIGHVLPCESTIRRCLQRLDPGVLDALIGAWMWLRTSHTEGRRIIALDGKSLRGARDAAGHLTHLLAALSQRSATVLGQMTVGAKTNKIPVLTKLLDTMDIADAVITADALHCQRGTAQYIVSRKAHYVLTVKGNQRNLRKQLKALPWKLIPVLSTDREHSHGRSATRRLKATESPRKSGSRARCRSCS